MSSELKGDEGERPRKGEVGKKTSRDAAIRAGAARPDAYRRGVPLAVNEDGMGVWSINFAYVHYFKVGIMLVRKFSNFFGLGKLLLAELPARKGKDLNNRSYRINPITRRTSAEVTH